MLAAGVMLLCLLHLPAGAGKVGGAYINSSPAGALVSLDNKDSGTTPLILSDLAAGEHYLKITMPGYYPTFATIEIKEGELKDFKYDLKPRKATLAINTSPHGAEIFIDGRFVGRSPKRIDDLLVIKHWIRINQTGYQLWEQPVKLEEGQVKTLEVKLKKAGDAQVRHKQKKSDCQTQCHDVSQSGAKVLIKSVPSGATVYLKDEAKGETPLTLYLYPGSYRLHVQKNDYIPQERELTVEAKQEKELTFTLEYDNSWKDMVYVPAGPFIMGAAAAKDQQPPHEVYLDAFYIDKYEVTNRQYRRFIRETHHRQPAYPHDPQWSGDEQPVVGVSWEDANAYAKWAGKRLPTEAEWEKAAKGLKVRRYPWGNDWQLRSANTAEANRKITAKVGSYPFGISPFGAYDMLGNVWEWCADWYSATYYRRSPRKNPRGPSTGRTRVIRGGSWNERGELLSVSTRKSLAPQVRLTTVGFRCAKDLPY